MTELEAVVEDYHVCNFDYVGSEKMEDGSFIIYMECGYCSQSQQFKSKRDLFLETMSGISSEEVEDIIKQLDWIRGLEEGD